MATWRAKLQANLQNLQSQAEASATRLRQQLQTASVAQPGAPAPALPAAGGAPQAGGGDTQYVRLPVESAKKLRWFDRQDLNMLIKLHLREKQELFEANAALRQALVRRGVSEAQLEAEVVLNNAHVDRLHEEDRAVGDVLALAAQAEVERLRDDVDSLSAQLDHMRGRLQVAQLLQQQPAAAMRLPSPPPSIGTSLPPGEWVALRLEVVPPSEAGGEEVVRARLVVQPAGQPAEGAAATAGALNLAALLQQLIGVSHAAEAAPALDPALLQQAHDSLATMAAGLGVSLGAAAGGDARSADEGSGGPAAALRERCFALEAANSRLQAELATAQQEAEFVKEAAERKLQEVRGRLNSSQQHLSELLRVAQDGRLEAEARCEAAERRVQLAEARAARLDSDCTDLRAEVKRLGQERMRFEKDVGAAEARAALAEAALQKAKGSAEADRSSAEALVAQRGRVAELEGQMAALQRQLAAAAAQQEALEGRLASSDTAAARALAELHEAEGVAAERDMLAQRLAVLEARMDETRVERSQLEASRAVAAESEAKRARAEEELVTTARLAAALEARLAAAAERIDSLQLEVQAAEAARYAALQSVEAEVAARWEAAGADRTCWPPAAQEEAENLEARLAAMLTALKTAQEAAEQEAVERELERRQLAAAQALVTEVEEGMERATREWQARERQLEADSTAAAMEVGDLRRAVGELGRERDRLLEEKQARERAAQQAAAAVAAAKRRAGSGALTEAMLSNGGGSGPLTPMHSARGSIDLGPARSPSLPRPPRENLDATDLLYLKNVLLKFLDAQLAGRTGECEVLLPAVATLLRATPQEFKLLRDGLSRAQGASGMWDPSSWFGSSSGSGAPPAGR